MYATTWLDRETYSAFLERFLSLLNEYDPEHDTGGEYHVLEASRLPSIAPFVGRSKGSIREVGMEFEGEVDACARLFSISRSVQAGHPPSVRIEMDAGVMEGVPYPNTGVHARYTLDYGYTLDRVDAKGHFIDAHSRLDITMPLGGIEDRVPVIHTVLGVMGLGDELHIELNDEGRGVLTALSDRFIVFPRPRHRDTSYLSVLREGKVAVGFDAGSASITFFRSESAETLQQRVLDIVDAAGRDRVLKATASWHRRGRDEYEAIQTAAAEVTGAWRVHLHVSDYRGNYVFRTGENPLGAELGDVTSWKSNFEVKLPIVEYVRMYVDAEREPGGAFRYRFRFAPEHFFPNIRKQPLADTPDGRAIPGYGEMERGILTNTPELGCIILPEDLAMLALFRFWSDGRDLIDCDYEE